MGSVNEKSSLSSCGGGGSIASLQAGPSVLALVDTVSSELCHALIGGGGKQAKKLSRFTLLLGINPSFHNRVMIVKESQAQPVW